MKPMGKSWVYFKRQFTFKTINLYDYRMSFIQKNLGTVISRVCFFSKRYFSFFKAETGIVHWNVYSFNYLLKWRKTEVLLLLGNVVYMYFMKKSPA